MRGHSLPATDRIGAGPGGADAARAPCDVCSVERTADGFVLRFGKAAASTSAPAAVGVGLVESVAVDRATAAALLQHLRRLFDRRGAQRAGSGG